MISNYDIMDYQQLVIEIDETQFYTLKLFIKTFLNICLSIYDMYLKNLDRLQNPRNSTDSISSFF